MIENITVNDKNGNGIFAEGLAYIHFLSSGKKYILYTMNEPYSTDRIKMYVGELTDTVGSLGKIPDEEWSSISKCLTEISHGEQKADIEFLSMSNATFNIGIPRKLAITIENKQSFKDRQATGVLANQQQQMGDVPAIEPKTSFFNNDEVAQSANMTQTEDTSNNELNIFNNPMKPEIYPQQPESTPQQQNGELNPSNNLPNEQQGTLPAVGSSVMQSQVPETMNMPNDLATSDTVQVQQQAPLELQNQITNQTEVGSEPSKEGISSIENENLNSAIPQEQPALFMDVPSDANDSIAEKEAIIEDNREEVTKDQALEALDILNRYFKNTKELPSSLIGELSEQKRGDDSHKDESINQMSNVPSFDVPPQPQPEIVEINDVGEYQNTSMVEEQNKTLSLTPNGIPSITPMTPDTSEYVPNNLAQQNMDSQPATAMNVPSVEMLDIVDDTQFNQENQNNQATNGYVASSNGPAIEMNATEANINEVPVVLPDNYNPQAIPSDNMVMGPGTLNPESFAKVA